MTRATSMRLNWDASLTISEIRNCESSNRDLHMTHDATVFDTFLSRPLRKISHLHWSGLFCPIQIQGVFFNWPPPKSSKYKKVTLG